MLFYEIFVGLHWNMLVLFWFCLFVVGIYLCWVFVSLIVCLVDFISYLFSYFTFVC